MCRGDLNHQIPLWPGGLQMQFLIFTMKKAAVLSIGQLARSTAEWFLLPSGYSRMPGTLLPGARTYD